MGVNTEQTENNDPTNLIRLQDHVPKWNTMRYKSKHIDRWTLKN